MSTSKHILVVEDEALIALDIQTTLEDLGHVTSIASDAPAAEAAISAGGVDLVILDYHLKSGTTEGLAKQLHERGIPFVVCSGTAGMAELTEVFHDTTFLSKPYTSDGLAKAVSSVGRNRLQ